MVPPEIAAWLLTQGPAGVIILCLITVIVVLFRKWVASIETQIAIGIKNAELALTCSEVLKTANANAVLFAESMQTFKMLTDYERRTK